MSVSIFSVIKLSIRNFVWELDQVVFIEYTRERPIKFHSAEILGWSLEKGWR